MHVGAIVTCLLIASIASAQASARASLVMTDSVHVFDVLAREPMIVEHPDGSLFVSGYSDPNPHLWKSTDRGKTWTRVNVGTEADGAIGNSDVDLAVAPDGTLYLAQMGFDRSVGVGTHIAMGVSKDAGATWKWTMLSRTRFVDRPWVEVTRDGTAHVIWNDTSGVAYTSSKNGGLTWAVERRVNDKGGSSHLAVGPGGELAVRIAPVAASGNKLHAGVDLIAVSTDGGVTWQKRAAPGERDWPPIETAMGTTTPRWVEPLAWDASGSLYSFWTTRDGLWLARSMDKGVTWTTTRLAQPKDLSYFPYLVARGKGELAATWFSGRGDAWRAHVATIDVSDTVPPKMVETTFLPDIWGLSSRREDPNQRSSAGEYLAAAFLRDSSIAVVSPMQNERAGRYGFSLWRLMSRRMSGNLP